MNKQELLDKKIRSAVQILFWVSIFIFFTMEPSLLVSPLDWITFDEKKLETSQQIFYEPEEIDLRENQKRVLTKTLMLQPDLKTLEDVKTYLASSDAPYTGLKNDLRKQFNDDFFDTEGLNVYPGQIYSDTNPNEVLVEYYLQSLNTSIKNYEKKKTDKIFVYSLGDWLKQEIASPIFGLKMKVGNLISISGLVWFVLCLNISWLLYLRCSSLDLDAQFGDDLNLWIPKFCKQNVLISIGISLRLTILLIMIFLPLIAVFYQDIYFEWF